MWFWQRKNTHSSILFWLQLAGMSAAIHLTLLGLFFFVFKDRTSRLSLIVTPELFNREITFTIAPSAKGGAKSKTASKAAASTEKKAPAPEKKKEPAKPVEKKQTTIANKKQTEKKVAAKKADKKVSEKKQIPEKKAEPVKKEAPPAPAKEAEKSVEKKPEMPIASATDTLAQVEHHELEVSKLGLYEKGLLEEFKVLHEEIVAQWAPPPGIASTCSCKITMLIDWEGVIRNFTVNESSGVLMYDIAAQKALTQVKMPKWTWGKEITITFN